MSNNAMGEVRDLVLDSETSHSIVLALCLLPIGMFNTFLVKAKFEVGSSKELWVAPNWRSLTDRTSRSIKRPKKTEKELQESQNELKAGQNELKGLKTELRWAQYELLWAKSLVWDTLSLKNSWNSESKALFGTSSCRVDPFSSYLSRCRMEVAHRRRKETFHRRG